MNPPPIAFDKLRNYAAFRNSQLTSPIPVADLCGTAGWFIPWEAWGDLGFVRHRRPDGRYGDGTNRPHVQIYSLSSQASKFYYEGMRDHSPLYFRANPHVIGINVDEYVTGGDVFHPDWSAVAADIFFAWVQYESRRSTSPNS